MSNQVLGDKIVSFRFAKHSPTVVVVEGIGHFQANDFNSSDLPFQVYDFVHFEPRSNLFQVSDGVDIVDMTPDQIRLMKEFINTLPEKMDLPFACYDPEKSNLYIGIKTFSEAKVSKLTPVLQSCDWNVAKYDTELNIWIPVKAVIMDDGSLILDPAGVCTRCQIFLTEAEWSDFPKPDESIPHANWKYDVDEGTWVDVRTTQESLSLYKSQVDGLFQMIELDKYSKSGIDYYSTVQNPIVASWIPMKETTLTTLFTLTEEENSIYEKLKTEFDPSQFKFADFVSFSADMTSNSVAFVKTLSELKTFSTQLQKEKLFWVNLPFRLWETENLTISILDQLLEECKSWVKTKYQS